MTTRLIKPISREARMTIFDRSKMRALIITLMPGDIISLRPKGQRKALEVSLHSVWEEAKRQERIRAQKEKAEKKAARKAGRK